MFFHQLPQLWNAIPIITLHLPIAIIKIKHKEYFWNHFVSNLGDDSVDSRIGISDEDLQEFVRSTRICKPTAPNNGTNYDDTGQTSIYGNLSN